MNNRSATIFRKKILRLLIVVGGIIAGQIALYGPSLAGQKVLLPLDILASHGEYLPSVSARPQDPMLGDLVENWEPARLFAISEFHSGRLPMWNPYQYAGCPVIWPKFSPFLLLECCTRSPVILAWTQLCASILAGGGLYLFLRRVQRVTFWAAAIPAWCYPATGFFIFWQGFPTAYPVYWLPWSLLGVHEVVRGRRGAWPISLSLVTGLVLVSGALDVAGQVLLVTGLYALWCLGSRYSHERRARYVARMAATLTLGWVLGFLLAAPFILPVLEYVKTGARMERRANGSEERPPQGLSALPQSVVPDIYGTTRADSLWISGNRVNQPESPSAAYTGMVATLLIAPLAWCSRRHRGAAWFWAALAVFGLSWCLDVPGLVALLRLPGLNMMSHNRLVFATSLSVLVLAGLGLDALLRHQVRRRIGFLLPVTCLLALFAWCFYRSLFLTEPIATQLGSAIARGGSVEWIHNMDDVGKVQSSFTATYRLALALSGAGLMGWLLLYSRPAKAARWLPLLGLVMVIDALWFAHARNVQCAWSLYYPRIPVLEKLSQATNDRVIGINCLPANLAETHGLRDIRGYDAVDPAALTDLLGKVAHPGLDPPPYALTQSFLPDAALTPGGISLPPVLDMLAVRHAILRGTPPPELTPVFQGDDYWVAADTNALSRVFVPRHAETVADPAERLRRLSSKDFNPRDVAYVEIPLTLSGPTEGRAEIASETSTRVIVAAHMTTPGLVVLADLWDKGWQAYVNGHIVPILRVNHAVRGVVLPVGETTLEFRYEPASFRRGLALAGVALVILFIWLVTGMKRNAARSLNNSSRD